MHSKTRLTGLLFGLACLALTTTATQAAEQAATVTANSEPKCSQPQHGFITVMSVLPTRIEGFRHCTEICTNCGLMRVRVYEYSLVAKPPARQEKIVRTFWYSPTAMAQQLTKKDTKSGT